MSVLVPIILGAVSVVLILISMIWGINWVITEIKELKCSVERITKEFNEIKNNRNDNIEENYKLFDYCFYD